MAILAINDSYGYELNQQLLEVLDVSESTLYPVLRKLEREGLIRSYSSEHGGRLRRYCSITEEGKVALEDAKAQWKALRDWIEAKFEEAGTNE